LEEKSGGNLITWDTISMIEREMVGCRGKQRRRHQSLQLMILRRQRRRLLQLPIMAGAMEVKERLGRQRKGLS
jgi:hypothetical protein